MIEKNGKFGGVSRAWAFAAVLISLAAPLDAQAAGSPRDVTPPCSGVVIESRAGSILDEGWTGLSHGSETSTGDSIGLRVLSRCDDSNLPCLTGADCTSGNCVATCDCDSDSSCDLLGPAGSRQCVTTLDACDTNADCSPGVACVSVLGPPQPLSSGGTPLCAVSHLDGPATGTFDSTSGDLALGFNLRRRVFLGISLAQPCPRCGTPAQALVIGDVFTCEGGQFPGASCTVEGTTLAFGGTSSDCPPSLSGNISGTGLRVPLHDLTTGATTRTAALPCTNFAFRANPLNPGSNPKCTDDQAGPVCSSNADCTRCTGDSTVVCGDDADCTGLGTCAEAPDQPITCGFWCNCGFCDGDASLPCFENGDCPAGGTCEVGSGSPTSQGAPQNRPNDCSMDGFVCGENGEDVCATTSTGRCSLQSYRNCIDDTVCVNNSAGTCVITQRPCFEPRITRSGSPSAPGSYCAYEDQGCLTNTDCTGAGDFCAADSARPELAALMCVPATSSSAFNSIIGLTGPAAMRLNGLLKVCRCGDGDPACLEVCEPPTTVSTCGDGVVQAGEDCDGGTCCATDCTLASAGTVCRGAADTCDIEETCDGSSVYCPADAVESSATVCRAATAACDSEEVCDGTSRFCPSDVTTCDTSCAFQSAGTVCRADQGACDIEETCDGISDACPPDIVESSATVCRASTAVCDSEELCTGSSPSCPLDVTTCGTDLGTLELSQCDLRLQRRAGDPGTDRGRIRCLLNACGATGGITPPSEGLALFLADTDGTCFVDTLSAGRCVQKGSSYVCKGEGAGDSGMRVVKMKAKDACSYDVLIKLANSDLSCMDPSKSPWVPRLTVGDDFAVVGCPVADPARTEAQCPGSCGDDSLDPGEECDGMADAACPGACYLTCACP